MADYEYLYQSRTEDLDLELSIEGALPESIQGTLYAIGGAGCKVGDTALSALDAHGRVVAVSIAGGKAQLRARMVQTPLWKAERGASAIVKRRLFTNKPGRWSNLFDLDLANPAGHNVVPWGKDVVAANDPGFFVLDPQTLETRGPAPIQPKKGATFGPMPRRDPATGRHVVFEQRPGLKDTIIVREIDDGFQVAKEQAYSLGRGAAFFHDVAFTERYYLIMQFASLSVPSFAWGAATALEALRFEPDSTPVMHLLPRAGGAPITVPLPGGRAHFHFWNAFEEGGAVVADTLGYDGKVTFGSLLPPAARPAGAPPPAATPKVASWRYHIDPASRSARPEKLDDVASEAPEIRGDRRGRSYRYGWAPAQGRPGDEEDPMSFPWFHALGRHDFQEHTTQVWDAGPRAYVSACAFVPDGADGAEDRGHVLAWIQDVGAGTATLGVFDARDVAAGPVARLTGAGLLGGISHVSFAVR